MPCKLYKESGKYCVHKLNADGSKGENVTCHPSPAAAAAHMKALYANTKEELAEEDMFFDVDDEAVKKFYREARKVSLSAKTYFVFTELSELEERVQVNKPKGAPAWPRYAAGASPLSLRFSCLIPRGQDLLGCLELQNLRIHPGSHF